MLNPLKFFLLPATILSVFYAFTLQTDFDKFSVEIETRKIASGKKVTVTGSIFYDKSGRMVTHIFSPNEVVVINNQKGDLTIYNPRENVVSQQFNYSYSSETTSLYYFLKDKSNQLGLKSLGFSLAKSRYDGDYLITTWMPPQELMKSFKEAELVYKNNIPVYLKFINHKNKPIKKAYYYNFKKVFNANFPQAITQIFIPKTETAALKKQFIKTLK